MSLPERINMVICISYDPAEVKRSLIDMNEDIEVTDEHVMEIIEDWALEDSRGLDYVLQDENGDEL